MTLGNGATAGVFTVASVGTVFNTYNTDIGNIGNNAVVVNLGFNGPAGPVGAVNIGRGATAVTIGNTAAGFRSAGPITLGTVATLPAQLGYTVFTEIASDITVLQGAQAVLTSPAIPATGIYTLCYSLRYEVASGASITGILLYLSVSAPTNSGNVAYQSFPGTATQSSGVIALSSSWTGLIYGGATFQVISFNNTVSGTVKIKGTYAFSNFSYTRIA